MNCAEFEFELQTQLDRRSLSLEKHVDEHLQTCDLCRETWNRNRLLIDAISDWREQVPDADLVDAVVAIHLAGPASGKVRTATKADNSARPATSERLPRPGITGRISASPRRGRWALAALTSGLGALVTVFSYLSPGHLPDSRTNTMVTTRAAIEISKLSAEDRERALLNHAGAAYKSLATGAAGVLEDFASIVLPVRLPDGAGDPDVIDATGDRLIDGLPHPLRPIGQGLGDAFDFLWEAGQESQNSRI